MSVVIRAESWGALVAVREVCRLASREMERRGWLTRFGLGEAGLETCRVRGSEIVLVLGHPEFYSRYGLSAELARPPISPFGGGEPWMAAELVPGAIEGVKGRVEFSPPFAALE